MSQRRELRRGISLPLLLRRSLLHRRSRTLAELIALTVSAAVATALLTIYASLDMQLHHQFRTFGANIIVTAAQEHTGASQAQLPLNALEIARQAAGSDSHVVPFAYAVAQTQDGSPIVIAGTDLAAVRAMDSWWKVSQWPPFRPLQGSNGMSGNPPLEALTGVRAEKAVGNSSFPLTYNGKIIQVHTAGTVQTGDAEDSRIYLPLDAFKAWTGVAPATLEIQAAGTPQHIQEILTRLQRALPAADVHAVHQLVDAEANVVTRTRSLMLYSVLLISLTVAVCVLATLTASVFERRNEFAIMKALGATQRRVGILFLLEAVILAIAGLVLGYVLGCGIADLIGEWNFHTTILPLWSVLPQVALLNLLVAITAAVIPMQLLRRLEPAKLLRGE